MIVSSAVGAEHDAFPAPSLQFPFLSRPRGIDLKEHNETAEPALPVGHQRSLGLYRNVNANQGVLRAAQSSVPTLRSRAEIFSAFQRFIRVTVLCDPPERRQKNRTQWVRRVLIFLMFVCLSFQKQSQIAVNKSKVSNGATQFEAPSAFKGNRRINNTMAFSSQLQFQVIVCNLCSFKRRVVVVVGVGMGVGRCDCWLCRNRMFQWLISCLSRLAFLCFCVLAKPPSRSLVPPPSPALPQQEPTSAHFTISAENECSRSGKPPIPDAPSKSELSQVMESSAGSLAFVS